MFVIDRFEGDIVVLEFEGRTYDLPRKIMPSDAKEGDFLTAKFAIDLVARQGQKEKIKALEDELFE